MRLDFAKNYNILMFDAKLQIKSENLSFL